METPARLPGGDDESPTSDPAPFEKRVRQLLWWPPDIFAVTSTVLARTGAYRFALGPAPAMGVQLWSRLDWQSRIQAHAEAWRSVVSEHVLTPINDSKKADDEFLEKLAERIADRCKRLYLEDLKLTVDGQLCSTLIEFCIRALSRLCDDDGYLADQNLLAVSVKADRAHTGTTGSNAATFFEALICLHVLADAASESIGVPRSSTKESAVFDALANVMLTLRGSLSTVSKFHGVVLPKLRTPQAGLTLRNLSHNLTFHDSEVEVMWRSFPWSNFDENTLNILYVPYPFDFDPKRFSAEGGHHESIGYFTYNPGDWKGIGGVVDLIERVREAGTQPHFLVFTETAFDVDTYKRLLTALSHRYGPDDAQRMPVVLAGVAKEEHNKRYNELRLATYFAGKWYQLTQHKHHRWQLTASQIRQYGLQGRLSTARPLFERMEVDQRRLTFYAPTPWLVLSPLICEDLSRIEPVSGIIRGVGPTLILALLLDGPQIAERWPGRYASVLADDPGTGVLTLTSYGIAQASRPESDVYSPRAVVSTTGPWTSPEKAVVASWKGQNSSFQKLAVSSNQALVVTLTADFGTEYTLDGRAIANKPAGFRLDGVKVFDMPKSDCDQGIDTRLDLGSWSDIREVTALTYVAAASLSLMRPHESRDPIDLDEPKTRTDTWGRMHDWASRCRQVRQLIDVMLGRPVFDDTLTWDKRKADAEQKLLQRLQNEKGDGTRESEAADSKYFRLKVAREALLSHIFTGMGVSMLETDISSPC